MRFLSFLRLGSLLLGLGLCLGCGSSSTGMRNFKEGTGPDREYGAIKSKDGKFIKGVFEAEPPEPQAPPLNRK